MDGLAIDIHIYLRFSCPSMSASIVELLKGPTAVSIRGTIQAAVTNSFLPTKNAHFSVKLTSGSFPPSAV